jgi:hypothetical protein
MQLQVGDRIVDANRRVRGHRTTAAGENAHVRVRRVDNAEVTIIRSWGARARQREAGARRGGQAMMGWRMDSVTATFYFSALLVVFSILVGSAQGWDEPAGFRDVRQAAGTPVWQ